MRIVSLLPSATEVVCLVAQHAVAGAGDSQGNDSSGSPAAAGGGSAAASAAAKSLLELVGRSHECDYPAGLGHLPMLTAAKTTWTNSADVDAQVREALAAGTGLYTVDHQALAALRPDAIITQVRGGGGGGGHMQWGAEQRAMPLTQLHLPLPHRLPSRLPLLAPASPSAPCAP
jgi:hypothetical protein